MSTASSAPDSIQRITWRSDTLSFLAISGIRRDVRSAGKSSAPREARTGGVEGIGAKVSRAARKSGRGSLCALGGGEAALDLGFDRVPDFVAEPVCEHVEDFDLL